MNLHGNDRLGYRYRFLAIIYTNIITKRHMRWSGHVFYRPSHLSLSCYLLNFAVTDSARCLEDQLRTETIRSEEILNT